MGYGRIDLYQSLMNLVSSSLRAVAADRAVAVSNQGIVLPKYLPSDFPEFISKSKNLPHFGPPFQVFLIAAYLRKLTDSHHLLSLLTIFKCLFINYLRCIVNWISLGSLYSFIIRFIESLLVPIKNSFTFLIEPLWLYFSQVRRIN